MCSCKSTKLWMRMLQICINKLVWIAVWIYLNVFVVHTRTGNDLNKIRQAIDAAKAELDRPSIIKVRTVSGCGSQHGGIYYNMQCNIIIKHKVRTVIGFGSQHGGTSAVHGAPLGSSDLAFVKTSFGFDPSKSFDNYDDIDNYDDDDGACNLPNPNR